MKILITGGGGYIGNVLTDTLINEPFGSIGGSPRGHYVTVLDNLIHRNPSIMQHCGK